MVKVRKLKDLREVVVSWAILEKKKKEHPVAFYH